jgi:hypothetical protein
MVAKKIFESKQDCKINFEIQVYVAGRCRERFKIEEIEEIKVKDNLERKKSMSHRWT